jgi:hypothetical protein
VVESILCKTSFQNFKEGMATGSQLTPSQERMVTATGTYRRGFADAEYSSGWTMWPCQSLCFEGLALLTLCFM